MKGSLQEQQAPDFWAAAPPQVEAIFERMAARWLQWLARRVKEEQSRNHDGRRDE